MILYNMTNEYKEQISEIIETLDLENETDKSILKHRFLGEVVNYSVNSFFKDFLMKI